MGGGSNCEFDAAVAKQFKKLTILYVVWSVVYLVYSIPSWISSGWFSGYAFLDFIIGTFKNGSHYHMWYLLSLLYALPIFWACLTFLKEEWFLPVSALLWIVKALSYGYIQFIPDEIRNILLWIDKFPALRDAIFCILPLLLLGKQIRMESKKNMTFKILGFAAVFFALCVEAFFLKGMGQTAVSYIFFTYPTAYFLMGLILSIRCNGLKKISGILGKVSIIVYCVHPIIGEVTDKLLVNSAVHYIVTVILATGVGWGLVFVEEKARIQCYV